MTRHKPKSAIPIACHSLSDMRAKEAIPILKSLADFLIQDSRPLPFWQLLGSAERMRLRGWFECSTRKGTLKGYVLWALAAIADPRGYAAVKA